LETLHGWGAHHHHFEIQLFNTQKMISLIIKLAQSQEWYGVSDAVEIAKGKNQYAQTWKQVFTQYKRTYKSWRMK
jgi:hypothetical protein